VIGITELTAVKTQLGFPKK